jgi:hypothetical protein
MQAQKKLYKRQWLNEDKGSAYVVLEAEHSSYGGVWASVEIKDCTRQVSLEFDYASEEERQRRLNKVDELIKTLYEMKAFIEETKPTKKKRKKTKTTEIEDILHSS